MKLMANHRRNQQHAYPWPLALIAAPAAVAIWSGWVGLGQMCGFGPVNLLPGFGRGVHLDTAITLPVGIESYGAYALFAWLALKAASERTRGFAKKSAIGALVLGCTGQVAFHILAAAHWATAPWIVTVMVACLPVVTLYFAATLTHLILADRRAATEAEAADARARAEAERLRAERAAARVVSGPKPSPRAATPKKKAATPKRGATSPATSPLPEPAATAAPEMAAPAPEMTVPEDVDTQAAALEILAAEPDISGAQLGLRLGKTERYGQMLKKNLASASAGQARGQGSEP